jgi:hypothetical protein
MGVTREWGIWLIKTLSRSSALFFSNCEKFPSFLLHLTIYYFYRCGWNFPTLTVAERRQDASRGAP